MRYSDKNLSQELERTEARANIDFVETRVGIDPSSGAEWIEAGGAYAMFDGVGSPLTQTFGLGIFQEATAEHLETIESFFKERGAPVFHEVSPLADQSILTLLGERGYRPIELTSVLFRDLSSIEGNVHVAESEITTRQIDESETDVWAETSARGWATIHESLAEFMLAFGKVAARTSGGHPFIAEINGESAGAAGFGIYDHVCILAGAATVPRRCFSGRYAADTQPIPAENLVAADRSTAGTTGEYFDNMDLAGKPAFVRADPTVNFRWATGSPAENFPADLFSNRWTGLVVAKESGKYSISMSSNDGGRLFLDDKKTIDLWSDHATLTGTAIVELKAGERRPVEIEHYENIGNSDIVLGWRLMDQNIVGEAVNRERRAYRQARRWPIHQAWGCVKV